MLKGFCSRRPLSAEQRRGMDPELAGKLQDALPVIPLTGFNALATAFGNDVDPHLTFAQLVWALGRPGDVLVGLTTSGNSRNVLAAADAARAPRLKDHWPDRSRRRFARPPVRCMHSSPGD